MKKVMMSGLVIGLLFFGCGEEATGDKETGKDKTIENCVYTFNPVKSKLNWTAYKFLNKTGVGGAFTSFDVEGMTKGEDPKAIIESLSFSIPVSTTETNDPSRNETIQKHFFAQLENTQNITGKVVRLDENKEAVIEITMNGITKEIKGSYTLNDNKFIFGGEINVLNWEADAGLNALNEECKDLHTDIENGDTESKLWPDVSISFSTELSKSCN